MDQSRKPNENQATCPYCGHVKCGECEETAYPNLWLGCCQCGMRAVARFWLAGGDKPED